MRTLILTEKPSVARDFAKGLGVDRKREGCFQNQAHIITWAVGHLVELLEPQDYTARWRRWRLEDLPIIPENFRYKAIENTQKQLKIVCSLLKDPSVTRVIIATDAGREGEVIARTILLEAGREVDTLKNDPNFFRFWTSQALTPSVVRQGMDALRPAGDYDRLWRAGQARQVADWLVGMNASRAASLQLNDLFSVGRVQTAVLALLVDRLRERLAFTPEPYWVLKARFQNDKGDWWGTWFRGETSRFDRQEEAHKVLSAVEGMTGEVSSVTRQEKNQPPPYLYSLTDLQRDANKRFGFSAQKTLTLSQSLYETRKCLSYPRTDSKVLGTKTIDLVTQVIDSLKARYSETFSGILQERLDPCYKRVFNDAKLTDHHAIIPLAPMPENASADEEKLYLLVLKRFAAAFHPDFRYEQTTIITGVHGETFRTVGKRTIVAGWRRLYMEEVRSAAVEEEEEAEDLPEVLKGDAAQVIETDLRDKQTQPPPEYTEALLLRDMINPSRYVASEDLKQIYRGEVGLGTQATRAQIIETLLKRKYAERKKRYLIATEKGCRLIDSLREFRHCRLLTFPEETARWEMHLNRIAQGEDSTDAFIEGIKTMVMQTVAELKTGFGKPAPPLSDGSQDSGIGRCPRCGGEIIEGKKGFGCSNWRKQDGGCSFVIWKTIAGRTLPKSAVRQLLSTGITDHLVGFMSKNGKRFSARLKIVKDPADGMPKVSFHFGRSLTKPPPKVI